MAFIWSPYANWRIPSSITMTSENTAYPKERLVIYDSHPYIRTARTTNISGNKDIIFDFGATVGFSGFAIFNTNFQTLQVSHSSDNVSYTSLSGSPYTIQKFWQFYRHAQIASVNNRYVRFRIPPQSTVDGASYYEVGSIVLFSSYNEFPYNPNEGAGDTLMRKYEESDSIFLSLSPPQNTLEFSFDFSNTDADALNELSLLGNHTPLLLFENENNNAACYILHLADNVRMVRNSMRKQITMSLRELV